MNNKTSNFELSVFEAIYGGFIGEKIPQGCSEKVFHELIEKGITSVIDLRHDYTSDRFGKRCEKYGIRYFRYPVHLDDDSIEYTSVS